MTDKDTAALNDIVSTAFVLGSATRTDLLTAAVAAHAPTAVIQSLLELPDRRFHTRDELAREFAVSW